MGSLRDSGAAFFIMQNLRNMGKKASFAPEEADKGRLKCPQKRI